MIISVHCPLTAVAPQAAQMIKEGLDKRLGATWHVVVGEGFGFDISYEISRS